MPSEPLNPPAFSRSIPSYDDFYASITAQGTDLESWAVGRAPNLYRILLPLLQYPQKICGPTLDVASGYGCLFRALRDFAPELLPYHITELREGKFDIDGTPIPIFKFECEKERLPVADHSYGTVFFCDVIEHLIVDPVWALLEFNRVLKHEGTLIISTPNVTGIDRLQNLLGGYNPINENQYKSSSIYQRHNREWTIRELGRILTGLGFTELEYCTHEELLSPGENALHQIITKLNLSTMALKDAGPEIVMIARKTSHLTLDMNLPKDVRWPAWLYTDHDNYRRRPAEFPIHISSDYS